MANLTFIEYLVELTVSDDPMQAMKDVKQAARSPERYKKKQMINNVEKQREIQKNNDDPLKSDKLRIAKLKQQVAAQEKRLAIKVEQNAKRAGVEK